MNTCENKYIEEYMAGEKSASGFCFSLLCFMYQHSSLLKSFLCIFRHVSTLHWSVHLEMQTLSDGPKG